MPKKFKNIFSHMQLKHPKHGGAELWRNS